METYQTDTIELANSGNYLDELSEIYPLDESESREVPEDLVEKALEAGEKDDSYELVKAFMEFSKFPYDDICVGFLRNASDEHIESNPETVNRIADRINDIGIEECINRCKSPKVKNRQMGSMFEKWVSKFETAVNPAEFTQFSSNSQYRVFDGSPNQMRDYIQEELNIELDKEPDLLAKCIGPDGSVTYVIGEAKLLTSFGGHQDRQLSDVISLVETGKNQSSNILCVGLVDGVPWLNTVNRKMCRKVRNHNLIFSAIFLPEFLTNLTQNQ